MSQDPTTCSNNIAACVGLQTAAATARLHANPVIPTKAGV